MRSLSIALATLSAGTRQVAKLASYPDGGWALIPGFQPQPHPGCLLLEVSVDYSRAGVQLAHRASLLREYQSAHGVKLSIHGDGYVQLSRVGTEGVLSGRDPITHNPRAFGFQSFPTTDPPRTGPTFGARAWGLDTFPQPRARSTLIVPETEFYVERPDIVERRTAIALEFWILPRWALPHAHRRGGLTILEAGPRLYYASQPVEFIVLDTGHPMMILGLVVTACHAGWPSPSGMSLHSPSDLPMRRTLQAISPPPYADEIPSADYDDAQPTLPRARTMVLPTQWVSDETLVRPWGRATGPRLEANVSF
jgi:hypothetical protein